MAAEMYQQEIDTNRRMALQYHRLSLKYSKEAENFSGESQASEEAHKCKQLVQHYNTRAVMTIMKMHSATHQNNDILDLHQLQVNEATKCLDLFIDHRIKLLRAESDGTNKDPYDLYIITAQGRRSFDGVAKIKLRTTERLRERGLLTFELNPGYLKVGVLEETSLSSELL